MFSSRIKKVGVIGSGVMGSQIAAHITNAGVPVVLLDIVPKDSDDRSALAKGAVAKMTKMEPSPFMHPENVKLITAGNLEDDLGKLSECDWIVEAVLENPQVKSDLYKKVDAVRKLGSVVSSNTSTLPLKLLTAGQSERFARDFLITHFFNPPRSLRLLEVVVGEKTSSEAASAIKEFCDNALGKGIVPCKDAPGFIANRIGMFFLQCAVNKTFELGLTVEEADAVFSKPFGMPRTGVFGLIDLIGLDLIPLIAKSFLSTLPEDDPYRIGNVPHPLIDKMIADGYTGRKGKGGFYRIKKTETGKVTESIDLKTGAYKESRKAKPESIQEANGDLRMLCEAPDAIGKFAWSVISQTLSYAASLVDHIADDIAAIDAAMRLGFNWQCGPFELLDQLGAEWFIEKLESEGRAVPERLRHCAGSRTFYRVEKGRLEYLVGCDAYKPISRPEGILLLADIKRATGPVLEDTSASLWDIGDGVCCFEFHSKMNAIDEITLALLKKSVALIEKSGGKYKGMVIYNEADFFSAGANLGVAMFALNISMYTMLGDMIRQGQEAYHALKFARFPTVSAPAGLALGGGCEISLHCAGIQAHAELHMGLVELLIGIIPCWGGCTQMLGRAFALNKNPSDNIAPVLKAFEVISGAQQSKSAFYARDMMFLRSGDGITMNRERLLFDAKKRVLDLAKNYKPPAPLLLNFPGAA
ncbi:MAG: 3-hydroxyacyl-CoA dehydrogenase/enoyl-CoA hydratase family protein, partial [Alphaproteobacteria bacterium]|nr:3-hydroxyacyl-CoA dehydrogenase/enoyl-CoA hydratase family protein [Alphaproteobacteria bacterium]